MLPQQLLEILSQTVPFSGLTEARQQQIVSQLIINKFEAGELILAEGLNQSSYLYIICSGQVIVEQDSVENTSQIISSHSVFGQYGLLRSGRLPYRVKALDQVTLALLSADVFLQLYHSHPRFGGYFDGELRVYDRKKLTLYDVSGSQFLFGTRLNDLINRKPAVCPIDLSIVEAARIMSEQNTDYLVVFEQDRPVGIFTDKLLRTEIAAKGRSLDTPLSKVLNSELHFLTQRHNLFEALFKMLKCGVSHILVRNDVTQKLEGVISHSDMARGQGYNPLLIIDQVAQMQSLEQLHNLRQEANQLLLQLYRRGVRAKSLITINTIINDTLTGRVLELSTQALSDHLPDLNFDWVWLSLGSEGRGEMSLKTDQDNALVYCAAKGNDSKSLETWIANWTSQVNQSLDSIGLKLCDGGMMASNPVWQINIQNWSNLCDEWLTRSQAQQVMQTSAACDLRAVHGNIALEERIKSELKTAFKNHSRFLKHMAAAVISNRPPINALTGRIRTLKTEEGQKVNLKRSGIQPITEFARILCLQAGYFDSSNTFDRLEYLMQTQSKIKLDVSDALDSYSHLNDIRLGHHLQAVSMGKQPDNLITVSDLSDTQYQMLKAAFRSVRSIQAVLAHRFNLM